MINKLLHYIYDVLNGDIPNTQESFFSIDGDLICDVNDRENYFTFLMEDGEKYKVTITKID
jgi:hypothetical protein